MADEPKTTDPLSIQLKLAVSATSGAVVLMLGGAKLGLPLPVLLALLAAYLVILAGCVIIFCWLVPQATADGERRADEIRNRRAAASSQLPRDLSDRSASSTTIRHGDDRSRRSWRAILSTVRSVAARLRRREVNQRRRPDTD